jgi:hypothetical protein
MIAIPISIQSLFKGGNIQNNLQYRVLLYRRFWDIDAQSVDIEATGRDITPYIITFGKVKWQLGGDTYGQFNLSNLSLTAKNEGGKFTPGFAGGLFPQNYYYMRSEISYEVGDGANWVLLFRGIVPDAPNFDIDNASLQIDVSSPMSNLGLFNAKDVGQKKAGQILIENSNTELITPQTGIQELTKLLRGTSPANSYEMLPSEYEISDLGSYSLPAKITLKTPLSTNENVYADYLVLLKDKRVDDLINTLLDAANWPADKRDISPVIFSGQAVNSIPNFADSFADGNRWAMTSGSILKGDIKLAGNGLTITNWNSFNEFASSIGGSGQFARNFQAGGVGTYRFRANTALYSDTGVLHCLLYANGSGYGLADVYVNGRSYTSIGYIPAGAGSVYSRWTQIQRFDSRISSVFYMQITPDNKFKAFGDNFSFSENNRFSGTPTATLHFAAGNSTFYKYVNFALYAFDYTPAIVSSMEENALDNYNFPQAISNIIDGGSNLISWGRLNAAIAITVEGEYLLFARVADTAAGINSAIWQPVALNSLIGLSKRYIQFKFKITSPYGTNIEVSNLELNYFVSGGQDYDAFKIRLADFGEALIDEGITELAKISGYNIGVRVDGTFFFNPRNEAKSVVKKITDDQIIGFDKITSGQDKLINRVILSVDSSTRIVDDNNVPNDDGTYGKPHPNSIDIYGVKQQEIKLDSFNLASSIDMAYLIAPTIYNNLSIIRPMITFKIFLDLSLEMGDFIKVYHNQNFIYDKSQNISNKGKFQKLQTWGLVLKIVGLQQDVENHTTTLTCEDWTTAADLPPDDYYEFPLEFVFKFGKR